MTHRVEKLTAAATIAGFDNVTVTDDGGTTHLVVDLPAGEWRTKFLNLYVDMADKRLLKDEIKRRFKYDRDDDSITQ